MPCRKVVRYYCRKCRGNHLKDSKVGRSHWRHRIK